VRLGRALGGCAFALAVLSAREARASSVLAKMCAPTETQCERADLAVSKLEKGTADFDYDTGWVPANSPIQIRLVVALHDRTQVDLGGALDSTWPDPITLTPRGVIGAGAISIDDGFEVSAQARFTVTVGGNTYSWTGNIPYVPNVNFEASATKTFDPWAWTGGDPSATTVVAQTPVNKVMQVPLTQSIIPIPGISGGFELDGSATYSAWYDSLRIAFDEVDGTSPIPLVDGAHDATRLLITRSPSFDTNLFIHGEVTHQITLHFIPAFYFQILGQDFTLPLADLPLPLPASSPEPWDFDPVPVHVPLPEMSIPNATVDVGNIPVGVATDELVSITNIGEEVLAGGVDTLAPMVEIETPVFSVTPQQSAGLKMLLIPQTAGPFDVLLHLGSNDPLQPDSYIHVTGTAGQSTINETGGCGCRTAPAAPAPWPLLGVPLFALLRRKKKQEDQKIRRG
jgi:MYXO-CTERM domain-containing protein